MHLNCEPSIFNLKIYYSVKMSPNYTMFILNAWNHHGPLLKTHIVRPIRYGPYKWPYCTKTKQDRTTIKLHRVWFLVQKGVYHVMAHASSNSLWSHGFESVPFFTFDPSSLFELCRNSQELSNVIIHLRCYISERNSEDRNFDSLYLPSRDYLLSGPKSYLRVPHQKIHSLTTCIQYQ